MTRATPDLHEIDAPNLWPDIERRIDAQQPTPVRGGARIAVTLVAAALAAGLLAWALLGLRGLDKGGPAIQPAQVGAGDPAALDLRARTWVVPEGRVAALIEGEGGQAPVMVPERGANAIVVRLSWAPQALEGGSRLGVVVIDGPAQVASQLLFASPTLQPTYGWDGRYQDMGQRYPWLAPTSETQNPDGSWSGGATAAYFDPLNEGPMWIIARFPRGAGILPLQPDDPPVVGVFMPGPDEYVDWAVQPAQG